MQSTDATAAGCEFEVHGIDPGEEGQSSFDAMDDLAAKADHDEVISALERAVTALSNQFAFLQTQGAQSPFAEYDSTGAGSASVIWAQCKNASNPLLHASIFGPFSAVSTFQIARLGSFSSIFRDLHDVHSFAPVQSQKFSNFTSIFKNDFNVHLAICFRFFISLPFFEHIDSDETPSEFHEISRNFVSLTSCNF